MSPRLERRYGRGDLHFITCSCYRRSPLLGSPDVRDSFLKTLNNVREEYKFILYGYVVMPEHFHVLISEPPSSTPSFVMESLKKIVSRRQRESTRAHFWYRRFYDLNVMTQRKINEKLNYMHFNPVKRGLVKRPDDWVWSSARFYSKGEIRWCAPNPHQRAFF